MKTTKSYVIAFAFMLCCASILPVGAEEADPILATNSTESVRQSELESELQRVPPHLRDEFVASPQRVGELLGQMLLRKTLATQARERKLDQDPANAERLRIEQERVLAQLVVAAIDKQAGAEFDQRLSQHQARAREIYAVDREKFRTPEEVSASHILIDVKKRSNEEARKLADAARARVAAGEDFKQVAREVSDDPSVSANGGALGWFTHDRMDPAFAKAAFAMKQVGAISEPVLSQFGWHIIRLDGRKESTTRPFDEVRDQIVGDLRSKYIEQQRDVVLSAIRNDPANTINIPRLQQIVGTARTARGLPPKPLAADAAAKP